MKSLHLSPSGALKKGWELTKKHFIVMLGLVLGYMVLLWVISLLSGADTTTFRYWILYLVNLVLSVWVNAGFAKILLNAYDGEEPSFSVFGELLPKLGGLIGVNVIVAVCYCIPLVLGFIVLFIGAGASAVSFNLADPYSFGHFMGQAFGGVTGILFLVLLLVSFYIALRLMFAVYAYVEDFSTLLPGITGIGGAGFQAKPGFILENGTYTPVQFISDLGPTFDYSNYNAFPFSLTK